MRDEDAVAPELVSVEALDNLGNVSARIHHTRFLGVTVPEDGADAPEGRHREAFLNQHHFIPSGSPSISFT
eukprot:scaffold3685_cov102-Isochrysis_galbana.AAC.7